MFSDSWKFFFSKFFPTLNHPTLRELQDAINWVLIAQIKCTSYADTVIYLTNVRETVGCSEGLYFMFLLCVYVDYETFHGVWVEFSIEAHVEKSIVC